MDAANKEGTPKQLRDRSLAYRFIIRSVLCHHCIIDCAERTPAACACDHAAARVAPKSLPSRTARSAAEEAQQKE
jgi:hypothetical protein